MKDKLLYWGRWVLVLPGCILGAAFLNLLLKWGLNSIIDFLPDKWIDKINEYAFEIIKSLMFPIYVVIAAIGIAPSHKRETGFFIGALSVAWFIYLAVDIPFSAYTIKSTIILIAYVTGLIAAFFCIPPAEPQTVYIYDKDKNHDKAEAELELQLNKMAVYKRLKEKNPDAEQDQV